MRASSGELAVSVIVATKDRPEMLGRCVDSLLACRHDSFDVIIVDQSERAAVLPDDARIVHLHTPTTGKSAGLNLGLTAARGAVFAFTDDDCTVPEDWLAKGTTVLTRHPEVDIVFGDLEPIEHDVTAVFIPSASFGRLQVVSTPRRAYVRGGAGANMFARREMFDRIGRYDELIGPGSAFVACEEYDIYFRALVAGSAVAFTPDVVTIHWGSRPYADGSGRMLKRMYAYGEGAVIGKHLRLGDLRMLPVLAHITLEDLTVAARSIVRSRRLAGVGTMAYKWRGLMVALFTSVDCRERVFVG